MTNKILISRPLMDALDASIEHWKYNLSAVLFGGKTSFSKDASDCALCQYFPYAECENDSEKCPIYIDSGQSRCSRTPWVDVPNDLDLFPDGYLVPVARELDYLISLREKCEVKQLPAKPTPSLPDNPLRVEPGEWILVWDDEVERPHQTRFASYDPEKAHPWQSQSGCRWRHAKRITYRFSDTNPLGLRAGDAFLVRDNAGMGWERREFLGYRDGSGFPWVDTAAAPWRYASRIEEDS